MTNIELAYVIHMCLWIIAGYIIANKLGNNIKDAGLWIVLVCLFGMTLAAISML